MKALAVVVTHNRVDLLSRCIDHLQRQSHPADAILIINNASTDGTVEMLRGREVDFITQENVGSAGGWHRGIAVAMDRGFDAVWLMDDDGYPDQAALGALVAALEPGIACASSVVLCEDKPEQFVFPFPVLDRRELPRIIGFPRKIRMFKQLAAKAESSLYPFAHFFNGALIDLAAVRKVGNVNRDFFIFGDEVDYFFRLRQAGKVVSVLNARHYHPDVGERPYTPAKIYYYVKNTLILNRRYFNLVWLRNVMTICAVLARTTSRNGFLTTLSYLAGRNIRVLAKAIMRGLQGRIGKDFNG